MPEHKDILFPHQQIRKHQDALLSHVQQTVQRGGSLIVHAPTGLGKTASALGPGLKHALDQDKTIVFLTSRHTQHAIAIETLQAIQDVFGTKFHALSIIGKKWLCLQPNVQALPSKDFAEYCKAMVADGKCAFYEHTRKGEHPSVEAKLVLDQVKHKVLRSQDLVEGARQHGLCPYEMGLLAANKARVIITDYFYLFNSHIRNNFLKRIDKSLQDIILVIDEAHNLPGRVKDLASEYLTTNMLQKALKEAQKYGYDNLLHVLKGLLEWFQQEAKVFFERRLDNTGAAAARFNEKYLDKDDFIDQVNRLSPYDDIIEQCTHAGDAIREEQQQSFIGSVGNFLEAWKGPDEGFTRILGLKQTGKDPMTVLSYRCLDPSQVTKDVLEAAHASILMSGTLTPTDMYADLLGIPQAEQQELPSPFPEDNRLVMVVPKTTTRYAQRNQEQYEQIAKVLAEITDTIPGNSAIFFPSYYLQEQVHNYFMTLNKKTILSEQPGMTKNDKETLLNRFKQHRKHGAVLLGVINGSFGEGIDLPGDELKGVIIVGLPLTRPDLETKALIDYYEGKFGKGWDYGYVFPAFQKVLQGAGRCIRSETDRGVIVFLDERFTWPKYFRLFQDQPVRISLLYTKMIQNFFTSS